MKKLFTLLLIFSSFNIIAQTDSTQRSTSVVFFGADPKTASNTKYNAQAIKLGLFQCFSGMYGLYYERELADIFGIQVGAGLTGRNFIYGALDEDGMDEQESINFNGPNEYDLADYEYNYKDRDGKMGGYFSLTPKLYYTEDGMDGPYLAFNFQYRRYNMEAYATVPSDPETYYYDKDLISGGNNIQEYENHKIYALSWGYQYTNSRTIIDYYVSAGLRNVNGRRRDLGEVTDSMNGQSYFTIATKDVERSQFFLEVGLSIGMWWSK